MMGKVLLLDQVALLARDLLIAEMQGGRNALQVDVEAVFADAQRFFAEGVKLGHIGTVNPNGSEG